MEDFHNYANIKVVGTTPVAGAIAVWPNDGGGYGHVAYVTSASGANSIQVMESNYAGNMSIGNYRGTFKKSKQEKHDLQLMVVLYTIFTHNDYKRRRFKVNFLESFFIYDSKMSLLSGITFRRENVEVKVKSF